MFAKNPKILRLKLVLLGVFAAVSAGMLGYEFLYRQPALKCEKGGGWWSNQYRACSAPIYLPAVTGRKEGEPRQISWPSVDDPQRTAGAPKAAVSSSAPASAAKP